MRATKALRIWHLVTYRSPGSEFGGPVTVAVQQTRELARRGHTVTLASGAETTAQGIDEGVVELSFRALRLTKSSWAGTIAPSLVTRTLEFLKQDILHIHLARDGVTLPVALLAAFMRRPFVLQPHGMVRIDNRVSVRVLDPLVRAALRCATSVFALTHEEREDLITLGARTDRVHIVPNAMQQLQTTITDRAGAAAQVLFLGRLHRRKNPAVFARAAISLLDSGVDATFLIAGPDEGEGADVEAIIDGRAPGVRFVGALDHPSALTALGTADVFVLPSVREVVPMTVIEAMMLGAVPIVTADNGLAEVVAEIDPGLVVSPEPNALADAIRRLVEDEPLRSSLASRGRAIALDRFSIQRLGDKLVETYGAQT